MSEEKKCGNYYPFGMLQKGYNNNVSSNGNSLAQHYKYNGKEFDESLGLNTYDFGARNYNPDLGRWMNIDTFADIAYSWTPYRYGFDNPINFVDPDGNYERDGHYWTVYLAAILVGHHNPGSIAYWAEEPDHVMSIGGDIVRATNTWLNPQWQKEIHALTGGDAIEERAKSRGMFRSSKGYLSRGYALHRLGDSFAHSKDGKMYPWLIGHALSGHAPDKIANRPELYLEYVQDLLETLGKNNVDTFTFDYVAESGGSTEENSAVFETEIRIREGVKSFDVKGNQKGTVSKYLKARDKKYGKTTKYKSVTTKVDVYKKNKKGEWVNTGKKETRTFFVFN